MSTLKYVIVLVQEKTFCKKTFSVFVLQFYLLFLLCKPLIGFSETMDYPVNAFIFPFIISNFRNLFLFILTVLYFFSDVPFTQRSGMYQVIRMGKTRWCLGQILAIVLRAFLMIFINMIFCIFILLGHAEFRNDWGKLLYTISMTNAREYVSLPFQVPYETLSNYSPLVLNGLLLLVGVIVITFFILFVYAISLYLGRVAALSIAVVYDILLYILSNTAATVRLNFSKWIPLSWLQIAQLDAKYYNNFQLPELSYIFKASITGIIILCILIFWKINRVDFRWMNEME